MRTMYIDCVRSDAGTLRNSLAYESKANASSTATLFLRPLSESQPMTVSLALTVCWPTLR